MSKVARTDVEIHPLIQKRFSPYAFDPNRDVAEDDVRALFEAARWSMSSYNAQPWRYILGVKSRDSQTWEKVHSVLLEGNQPWALNAPVLALGVVEHNFEYNGKPNKAAFHDLGAASALLTIEATSRDLFVHQMIGIDVQKAQEVFAIDGSLEPVTAIAIGYLGDANSVGEEIADRDAGARERKPVSEFVLRGAF